MLDVEVWCDLAVPKAKKRKQRAPKGCFLVGFDVAEGLQINHSFWCALRSYEGTLVSPTSTDGLLPSSALERYLSLGDWEGGLSGPLPEPSEAAII